MRFFSYVLFFFFLYIKELFKSRKRINRQNTLARSVIVNECFLCVLDGNAAGTGPGDPWTGGGGGVQPPYSGYAPPHLAQPAYPMHLPHDPMVSDSFLLSVLFFPSFVRTHVVLVRRSITRDCARFFGLDIPATSR